MSETSHIAHDLKKAPFRTADVLFDSNETNMGSSVRFADLHLSPELLKCLANAGFIKPSPVQVKAIPVGRMGMDMIVQVCVLQIFV